jgi:hypothetical protein
MTSERIEQLARMVIDPKKISDVLLKSIEVIVEKAIEEEYDGLVGYWSKDDFLNYYEQEEAEDGKSYLLTESEAEDCLQQLKEEWDASLGITWSDIRRIIIDYKDAQG